MSTENPSEAIAVPGDVIGEKFVVERIIGEGGMGLVMMAMHAQLGERVALKFLRRETLSNPEVVARFKNEARAAVKLKSNHVARVLDVGSYRGVPFMVMEYLEGHDLGNVISRRGPLPIEEAAELVVQACEGLAEAHARSIVHRDIKPENLFIVESHGLSALKILDFGISKATLSGGDNLVQTTQIMGSPFYMSPEQLRSTKHVDLRADIWSLGSVLFELLAADRPFEVTDSLAHLIAAITLERPRDLGALRPDIPKDLVEIVMRCLEKDPGLRFQNTGELALALLPFAPRRSLPVVERALAILRASDIPGCSTLELPSTLPPLAQSSRSSLVDSSGRLPSSSRARLESERTAIAVPDGSEPSPLSTTGSPLSTAARSQSVVNVPAGGKNNLVLLLGAGLVGLGLAVAAFVVVKPSSSKVTTPAPSAAAEGSITVILRAEPREAKFTIDNGPPLENPYVGKHARSNERHVIRAHAPGYKEKTREVNFGANVTLGIQLAKDGGEK